MKEELINLIYPRRCPICEKVLAPKEHFIHPDCKARLVKIREPKCMRCGKPVEAEKQEYCFDCYNKNLHFIKGFPCFKYDRLMSKSISAFKYKGKREYADFYVEEILDMYETTFCELRFNAIIPIPIHKTKYRVRGFNQAEIIARMISERISVPIDTTILIRSRKTLPQKELNDKERLRNLEQAFDISESALKKCYDKVLLVDDIYTTGSTIEACTKKLLSTGIKEVYYTSICIGHGY